LPRLAGTWAQAPFRRPIQGKRRRSIFAVFWPVIRLSLTRGASASGEGTNSVWWSPDGTRLAYDAFDEAGDGELSLFVINTDGTGLHRLNRAGTLANIAAWYPPSAP
jgi:hypothetical protein